MYIKHLNIVNFKNILQREFQFSNKINCFVGNNGQGKTNVLDAIHYLSLGKSFFHSGDVLNINHHQDFFVIEAKIKDEEQLDSIFIGLKKGQKKVIKQNNKTFKRIADYVGKFPLVMISPYDSDLITEGSEHRRKFVDSIIGQSDKIYLKKLIRYNKVVQQRNALLKYFAKNQVYREDSIAIYNQEMITLGTEIHRKRTLFFKDFLPIFKAHYQFISQDNEVVNIIYDSVLNEQPLEEALRLNLQKDRVLQYSSVGIHKDDFKMEMKDRKIKKYGSQGQQKSFLIALKLAKFDFLKNLTRKKPLLLLDDVFDKLDESRVTQLIKLVNKEHFGQIFITDTHTNRTQEITKRINSESHIFNLNG